MLEIYVGASRWLPSNLLVVAVSANLLKCLGLLSNPRMVRPDHPEVRAHVRRLEVPMEVGSWRRPFAWVTWLGYAPDRAGVVGDAGATACMGWVWVEDVGGTAWSVVATLGLAGALPGKTIYPLCHNGAAGPCTGGRSTPTHRRCRGLLWIGPIGP